MTTDNLNGYATPKIAYRMACKRLSALLRSKATLGEVLAARDEKARLATILNTSADA